MIKKEVLFGLGLLMILVVVFGARVSSVSATAFNTPAVDGAVVLDATDWDADELLGASGGSVSRNLYVTWDNTYLYVGITGASSGSADVYIDTVAGGQQNGVFPGDFQIASGSGGYEFLWRINNAGTQSWNDGRGAGWSSMTPSTTFARSTDLEVQIPWSVLTDYTPGNRISILVLTGANPSAPTSFWPNVTGNTITPSPSFVQAFIFSNAGSDGVVPSGGPTAVTLQSIHTTTNTPLLAVVMLVALLLTTAVLVTRRRTR